MNIRKNKKIVSLRHKLLVPTNVIFIAFVAIFAVISCLIYSTSMTKESIQQVDRISQQVLNNYETYFTSVITSSNDAQLKIDNANLKQEDVSPIQKYFDTVMDIKKEINNISIYDMEGNLLVANSTFKNKSEHIEEERWFTQAISEPLIHIFSRIDRIDDSSYSFTFSKKVMFNKMKDQGVMKVEYNFDQIIQLISKTDLGEGGHITIYDRNYNIVYSSKENISDEEVKIANDLVIGQQQFEENGKAFILNIYTIVNTTWRVGIVANNNAIKQTIQVYLSVTMFLSLIAIIIYIVVLLAISSQITKPIILLQQEMEKVENFNYDLTMDQDFNPGSKEIMDLNNNFNQMMIRIKELMKKVLEERESQRKSELKALQNQINPHFLYNTLDSIIYLIDQNENQKASQMIMALSKFFRISISRGKNIISIEKEVEHAKNYLIIQKMRYEDNFEYSIQVQESILQYPILKLILQPIIENAIAYGIHPLSEVVSRIDIKGYQENDFIYFNIQDNGFGMSPEKIEEIYQSFKDLNVNNGVGLKNVYQRIQLFYGTEADVQIESEMDSGTNIKIIIPIKEGLKYEN